MDTYNKKSKSVENVFNKIAETYVNHFGEDWEFINEIEDFASNFEPNSTIVDLGCGSGYITEFLTKKDLNAIGIDFSSEMIKIAKKKYPNNRFILDDFINLKKYFKEDSVDGAILIYSLYFVPKEQLNEFFKILSNVLKKGAKVLFVTQIGNEEKYVKTSIMLESGVDETIYVNYNMKEQLEELLSNNNFTIDYFKQKKVMDYKDITDDGRYIVLVTNNK